MGNVNETWKDIDGYDGMYKISNLGNVYSLYTKKILSQGTRKDGYKYVILNKNGKKKYKTIHRLVAEAFICNPCNLPCVNHKDENPSNNNVDNLEWCTWKYNATYNDVHLKRNEHMKKTVYAYDKNACLIGIYTSTRDAANKLNSQSGNISDACNKNYRTCNGYLVSYTELPKDEVLRRFKLNEERKFDIHRIGELAKEKLSKQVDRYTLEGVYIDSYPSTQEASRKLDISQSLIAGVCRGEHKSTHGFIFKYA